MNPVLQLVIGVVLVSGAITYSLWIVVRVLLLRQDLYDLRDHLFDEAAKIGALKDPAYRDLRNTLNGLARIADRVNIPTAVSIAIQEPPRRGDTPTGRPESPREDVQHLVDVVYDRLSQRLLRYLLLETAPGWVLLLAFLVALLPLGLAMAVSRALANQLRSQGIRRISCLVRTRLPEVVAPRHQENLQPL